VRVKQEQRLSTSGAEGNGVGGSCGRWRTLSPRRRRNFGPASRSACGIFGVFPGWTSCFNLARLSIDDTNRRQQPKIWEDCHEKTTFARARKWGPSWRRPPARWRSPIRRSGSPSWCRSRPAASPTASPASSPTSSRSLWKQQVIVENRPGIPGTTAVAKSTTDGYTLMLTSNGHTIAGAITKSLQYDPVKDFAGVTQVASVARWSRSCRPTCPVKTLKDFVDPRQAEARHAQLLVRPASPARRSCLPRSSASRPISTSSTCRSAARRRPSRRSCAATSRCISRRSRLRKT